MRKVLNNLIRFERYFNQYNPGCWNWNGTKKYNGYGVFSVKLNGKWCSKYAHRYMWELNNGPIPKGLLICHHCDNPGCVRLSHLFIGTYKDNSMDASKKGRCAMQAHPELRPRGQRNGSCKITKEKVLKIRDSYRPWTMTRINLAKRFCISRSQINRILSGKSWKHV